MHVARPVPVRDPDVSTPAESWLVHLYTGRPVLAFTVQVRIRARQPEDRLPLQAYLDHSRTVVLFGGHVPGARCLLHRRVGQPEKLLVVLPGEGDPVRLFQPHQAGDVYQIPVPSKYTRRDSAGWNVTTSPAPVTAIPAWGQAARMGSDSGSLAQPSIHS